MSQCFRRRGRRPRRCPRRGRRLRLCPNQQSPATRNSRRQSPAPGGHTRCWARGAGSRSRGLASPTRAAAPRTRRPPRRGPCRSRRASARPGLRRRSRDRGVDALTIPAAAPASPRSPNTTPASRTKPHQARRRYRAAARGDDFPRDRVRPPEALRKPRKGQHAVERSGLVGFLVIFRRVRVPAVEEAEQVAGLCVYGPDLVTVELVADRHAALSHGAPREGPALRADNL